VTFPKWHWLIKEILVAIFVLVELDLVYASLSSINAFVRTRAYTGRNAPVTM
jgi:hypothetical protein